MGDDPYEGTDIGGGRRDFSKPNYASNANSRKAREAQEPEEQPKLKKIIEGTAVQRKKPLGARILETFSGDTFHNTADFVVFEVILPAAKNLVADIFKEGVERMLFGDSRPRSTSGFRPNERTNYSRVSSSTNRSEPRRPEMSYRARANHDFQQIILPDRGDAMGVIDELGARIDEFGVATVADLYDLVGITGSFLDLKWGWTDIRGSDVRRTREGDYLLDLPKPIPLD